MKSNAELFQELALNLYVQVDRTNYLPVNATDEEAATHELVCRANAKQALISAGTFMQEFMDVEPMLRGIAPALGHRCVKCGGHREDGGPVDPVLYPTDARLLCDTCFNAIELEASSDHRR